MKTADALGEVRTPDLLIIVAIVRVALTSSQS